MTDKPKPLEWFCARCGKRCDIVNTTRNQWGRGKVEKLCREHYLEADPKDGLNVRKQMLMEQGNG